MLGEDLRYVGRGGLKLEWILEQQNLSLEQATCMDIGASTGGFTDCMLQHGAKKVYAIDVGHGQLADSLRQDERVVCMEGTDIRTLPQTAIAEPIDFISVDVSFISLERILPDICRFLSDTGRAVLLIKPQFEAGRSDVGKNGIVRSKNIQYLCPSPIRGGSGNIEYLVQVQRGNVSPIPYVPEAVAEQAWSQK